LALNVITAMMSELFDIAHVIVLMMSTLVIDLIKAD
jgi:hypothetical protein